MDPRLLTYYNRELTYLRELGGEFAKQFPKIAGRLGLETFECADPYVERLLEGFAFLAARVQLKIDAEFPRFTEHLLEMVYPHYLAPTPSMTVVQMHPDPSQGVLNDGFPVPRGTSLRSNVGRGEQTPCLYRTGHDLLLWPLEIAAVAHTGHVGQLGEVNLRTLRPVKSALHLKLRTTGGIPFDQLALERLPIFVHGPDVVAMRAFELIHAGAIAAVVREPGAPWREVVPRNPVRALGFEDDEALLPCPARSFRGYRLLQEYFAAPKRFLFFELDGLGPGVRRCRGTELDVTLLLDRYDPEVESSLTPSQLCLFCTPAVNLFPHKADRIHLSDATFEYHVVPDRTRPTDLEIHSVTAVEGFGSGKEEHREFMPFYSSHEGMLLDENPAYYTVHRRATVASSRQRRSGSRSAYTGSETFLSLVDGEHGPFRSSLRQLAVATLCTNRDLPLYMPRGTAGTDFHIETGAPINSVRCVVEPTPPRASHAWGGTAWRLISHLSLNYLSLTNSEDGSGADALRGLLKLYGDLADVGIRRQIDGVRTVSSTPTTQRIPGPGPANFARGIEVTVQCDETAFEGSSAFLLGSVLERFFAKYVSLNSFSSTVLRTTQRGEIMRWPARIGGRPIA